jgi:hypothetical protein
MKHPDSYYMVLFQKIYGKEGNPEELKQFRKNYYVPDWNPMRILNLKRQTEKSQND